MKVMRCENWQVYLLSINMYVRIRYLFRFKCKVIGRISIIYVIYI